jgi:hypothetical protein
MASKGESKATCFGSLLQLPPAKIGKVPLRVQFQIPCQPEPHLLTLAKAIFCSLFNAGVPQALAK